MTIEDIFNIFEKILMCSGLHVETRQTVNFEAFVNPVIRLKFLSNIIFRQ